MATPNLVNIATITPFTIAGQVTTSATDVIDTSAETDYDSFEGNILIMLSYDTYPDDTIKLRFKYNGEAIDGETIENEQEMFGCADRSIYYLDSEEQEHPHDYSGFQDLCSAVEEAARL